MQIFYARRTRTALALLGGLVAATAALSACSSSNSATSTSTGAGTGATAAGSSSACTQAKAQLVQYEKPVQFAKSIPPVDMAALKGKTIWIVFDDLAVSLDNAYAQSIKQAAQVAGVSIREVNGQGTPTGDTQGFLEAVSAHAAAIYGWSITATEISEGLQKAQQAGIPVGLLVPGLPPEVKYWEQPSPQEIGPATADFAFVESGCKAGSVIGMLDLNVLTLSLATENAFVAQLKKLCPTCQIVSQNITDITSLTTASGPDAVSLVQQNPKMTVLVDAVDPLSLFVVPALQNAHLTGVKVVGLGGSSAPNQAMVKAGTEAGGFAEPNPGPGGWQGFDWIARIALHQPASEINAFQNIPQTLLTTGDYSTVEPSLNVPGYQQLFEHAWGVS